VSEAVVVGGSAASHSHATSPSASLLGSVLTRTTTLAIELLMEIDITLNIL
jgi:hypothetical protein